MTADGSDPAERRTAVAKAIVAHRRAGSESPVRLTAPNAPTVNYRDREVVVHVDDVERDRLDAVLSEFSVFKLAQPATRKAPDGEVHVSAIADPKHAADFLDRLFLDVFGQPENYDLRVEG